MRETDLQYYQSASPMAPLRFALDALLAGNRTRRLSMLNRLRDYVGLMSAPALRALHADLNQRLCQAALEYDGYDYGEGYFYQGLAEIGVSGLRDTDARVEATALRQRLKGLDVLEIGCNAGFLANLVADVARSVTCLDINPHLVGIAGTVARHLGRSNLTPRVTAFEDFATGDRFDAVLSFANHSTFDGNTRQTVEAYLRRCRDFLRPDGLFLFESHSPAYEGEGLAEVCRLIELLFHVEQRSVPNYGSYLDRGRTFIVART